MAIPAMAPAERFECWDDEGSSEVVAAGALEPVGVGAGVVLSDSLNGFSSSAGQGSPGSNMKVLSSASCFCVTSDVVAFGLITPTIW